MAANQDTHLLESPFTLEDLAAAYYAREDMLAQAQRCAAAIDQPPRPGEDEDDPDFVPDAGDSEDTDAGAPPQEAPDKPVRPNSDNEENLPPHSPEDDANAEPLR